MAFTLINMRRLIVRTLLRLCEVQDFLRLDYLTHSHVLASWSADLDGRWHTGVWTPHTPDGRTGLLWGDEDHAYQQPDQQ